MNRPEPSLSRGLATTFLAVVVPSLGGCGSLLTTAVGVGFEVASGTTRLAFEAARHTQNLTFDGIEGGLRVAGAGVDLIAKTGRALAAGPSGHPNFPAPTRPPAAFETACIHCGRRTEDALVQGP